tara:strand:+ start:1002 stop:1229 length:228 start_codon:yes stop_codon:yes gene_type:complete
MASIKEQFLNEMQSQKYRQLSINLAKRYLYFETLQSQRIEMIQTSLKCRRDCYPYVPVGQRIKYRIGIIRGMIII